MALRSDALVPFELRRELCFPPHLISFCCVRERLERVSE